MYVPFRFHGLFYLLGMQNMLVVGVAKIAPPHCFQILLGHYFDIFMLSVISIELHGIST